MLVRVKRFPLKASAGQRTAPTSHKTAFDLHREQEGGALPCEAVCEYVNMCEHMYHQSSSLNFTENKRGGDLLMQSYCVSFVV